MEEFANGATQVTVRLKSGSTFGGVLISNSSHIVAIRGYEDLPFSVDDIAEIFQSDLDKNPVERGGWQYWDEWRKPG